jgi:hypothetical protein
VEWGWFRNGATGRASYNRLHMRVTVSHNKGLQGAMKLVNDSADNLVTSAASGPVQVTDIVKHWNGSTMDFSFVARMGIFNAPIKGQVICAERDVTIDVELPGMLKHFIPEEKVKQQVEGRVRGLLNSSTSG